MPKPRYDAGKEVESSLWRIVKIVGTDSDEGERSSLSHFSVSSVTS